MGKRKTKLRRKRKNTKHRLLFIIGGVLLAGGIYFDIRMLYEGMVLIGSGMLVEVFA